ncbi:MAG: bifunctional phosphoribosylaminoimidazolecarboxamide formyltransferase/IMP cyclohydrolase [Bdellovibrio sp.]|nr:bifunctional phosphoribosylaminoimidazolecarboxamide formyltransferase/IMP cyclohydrolase [Bdellovibrio sp.]
MQSEFSCNLKIRRALISVSDKTGISELAKALAISGTELIASSGTTKVLRESGLRVIPIEKITGNPEAFQGRMKTLSFQICSGILYRRGHEQDEVDLKKLNILPVDCVIVNFYPFQRKLDQLREEITKANKKSKRRLSEEAILSLIEEIDIGGPTLVRAAAKNFPHVLVITKREQYKKVIQELNTNGSISLSLVQSCTRVAWEVVLEYDRTIAQIFGMRRTLDLKYGENPHQSAYIEYDLDGPVLWGEPLTHADISYNNILDLSACYSVASDLMRLEPESTHVVIVKHNNPAGVASVPRTYHQAQKLALQRAWEGDPVSAFGGVILFSDELEENTAQWLSDKFIELVSSPGLTKDHPALLQMLTKRKNLKALAIKKIKGDEDLFSISVPGGRLYQKTDQTVLEDLKPVTLQKWPKEKERLARFGIAVCRALKSNAIAIVREVPKEAGGEAGCFQLVGAGQGQPNRVDALVRLAIPRARIVLETIGGVLSDCVLVSDAFFPFRDSVDQASREGIRWIVQPGGSIKDAETVSACDEHGIAMVFTGVRHFRH